MKIQSINNNKNSYQPNFKALVIKGDFPSGQKMLLNTLGEGIAKVSLNGGSIKRIKDFLVLKTVHESKEEHFIFDTISAYLPKLEDSKNKSVEVITNEVADTYVKAFLKKHPEGLKINHDEEPVNNVFEHYRSPANLSEFGLGSSVDLGEIL